MKKRVYKQDNGWCYDVLTDIGDLIIKQDTKPAVGGFNGFKTKEDATHIADLVVALMEEDLSPSVTVAQVTNAKTLDVKGEIRAVKEAIEKAKDAPKPKNLQ
jgi:hypothetical protein